MRGEITLRIDVVELEGDDLGDRKLVRDALIGRPAVVVTLGDWASELLQEIDEERKFLAGLISMESRFTRARGVLSHPPAELEVEQLLRLNPDLKTIGVLYDPRASTASANLLAGAVRRRGLGWQAGPVESPAELPRTFQRLAETCQAVVVIPDPSVVASRQATGFLVLGALEKNILLYTRSEVLVKRGVLSTLTADPAMMGRILGRMASAVAREQRDIAELAWETPSFDLLVNRKTARSLGVTLPDAAAPGDLARLPVGTTRRVSRRVPVRVLASTRAALPEGEVPGLVVLRLRISAEGKLLDTEVMRGGEPLAAAAAEAVKGWRFAAAQEDGVAVESWVIVTVEFDGQ